jgi:4-carboxymuconolactone decarboxylase
LTGPLLTPLDVSEWGDDEYAAVGALFGIPGEDVPRAGSGHSRDPLNFDILGVLARHPKMARVFMSYNAFLLQRGELPLRLRELAILRLSHARRSAFLGPSSRPRLPCALGQHAGPGLTGTRKPR